MSKPKLWTKDFLGISLASFFLFIPFYILMITLPIYTLEDLGGSKTQVGLIVTIFLIAAVLIRPFTGKLLEVFGKKEMLYFSLTIFLLATILYLGANTFELLLILRFFHGIGFGIATIATGTIVADIIPQQRRGEGMGYFALFMNVAMVIGPFLGLTIIQYTSFQTLFILTSFFSLAALIAGMIPNIPKQPKVVTSSITKKGLKVDDLFEKSVLPIALMAGILSFTYASVLSFISIYAKEINLVQTASFFFVMYAVFLILSRPFTGRWFDLYGENYVIYPSIFLYGIGMLFLSQTTHSITFLLAGALIGIGYGTVGPAIQTIAINTVPAHRRGTATATFFTFFDGGLGIGSFVLGIVAAYTGLSRLYLYSGFFILASIGLYYLLHGRFQSEKKRHLQREQEREELAE